MVSLWLVELGWPRWVLAVEAAGLSQAEQRQEPELQQDQKRRLAVLTLELSGGSLSGVLLSVSCFDQGAAALPAGAVLERAPDASHPAQPASARVLNGDVRLVKEPLGSAVRS